MITNDHLINDYFEWMYGIVCDNRYAKQISYRKLLMLLHSIEFTYSIRRDINRAKDGESLRRRFSLSLDLHDTPACLDGPCSVLEMMLALAIRCEENIMDDTAVGDRTGQWFWGMIVNMGLGSMTDARFDKQYAEDIIFRFLDRDYDRDGKGGLFTVRHRDCDMRDIEIWRQLCYYLDEFS